MKLAFFAVLAVLVVIYLVYPNIMVNAVVQASSLVAGAR